MRYILGMNSYNKLTKERWEGLATIEGWGLYPKIKTIEEIKELLNKEDSKPIKTKIYNSIEEIQKDISDYAIRFRRDDVWHKEQIWKKSKYILNFYPIKVDSSKFPFKVKKNENFKGNIYNIKKRG